jgi:NAD(P)H-flavin reductase
MNTDYPDLWNEVSTIGSTKLRNSYQLIHLKISAIGSVTHVLSANLARLRKRITLSGPGFKFIFRRKSESVPYLALAAAFCCSI